MDLSFQVQVESKLISIMAIPLYVPEGIGPVHDANNNQQQQQGELLNPPRGRRVPVHPVVLHQVRRPDQDQIRDLNQQERPIRRQNPAQLTITRFPSQLIRELYQLYDSYVRFSMDREQDQRQGRVVEPDHGPLGENNGGDLFFRHGLPLPDLVQCTQGLSLDLTFSTQAVVRRRSQLNRGGDDNSSSSPDHSSTNRPSNNVAAVAMDAAEVVAQGGPVPSTSRNLPNVVPEHEQDANRNAAAAPNANEESENEDDVLHEDWSVELKLFIGPWRQTGLELRAIADRFQEEYSTQNPSYIRRYRFRLFVNYALVPAAAMMGLAWIWNRR